MKNDGGSNQLNDALRQVAESTEALEKMIFDMLNQQDKVLNLVQNGMDRLAQISMLMDAAGDEGDAITQELLQNIKDQAEKSAIPLPKSYVSSCKKRLRQIANASKQQSDFSTELSGLFQQLMEEELVANAMVHYAESMIAQHGILLETMRDVIDAEDDEV